MNLTSIRCGKKRPIRQPQENNNFNTVFNVSVESAAASFVKDSRRRELIIIDLDDDVENVNNCCVDAEAQKSLCGPDDYRFGISPSSVVARTTGNCTVSNQSESTQAVCLTPMAILPVDHSLGPPEGGESIRCVICQLDLSLNDVTDRVNHVNACLDSLESPPKHAQGMDTVDVDELEVYVPNGPEDGDLQSVVGLTASELCCVVCGLDISKRGLFSRCFHIKRCAREHMISVKDVIRMLSDHDDITDKTDDNETDLIRSDHALSVAPIAAVHNINSVLMQNAKNSVKMTGKLSNPNDRSAVHQMKQSSEERNVNNLLMSAAREAVAVNKRGIEESKDMVKRGKSKRAYTGGWGNTWNKDAAKGTLQENYAPDYKKIQYDTLTIPIVVDGFHYISAALTDTYFLTHFHSDHYGGLTSKFNCGRIYCSPATSALTQLRLRVPPSVLVPLALEMKHTIVIGGAQVAVTLIDANHCPGAVLLLFEFRNGKKVLHTGDFRYNREMLMRSAALRELSRKESNPRNLVVYLDTTYCDPQYCFPDQSSAIQAVIETVRNEMKNETETSLFAFGAYGIGKERVFMAVAQALNLKVSLARHLHQIFIYIVCSY